MSQFKRIALMWALGFLVLGVMDGLARGNDVELQGTVSRVDNTSTQRALTLHVMGFNVPVQITNDTQFELDGDDVGLAGIEVGDFVKVSGYFSNAAIVAEEVELLDLGSGEFRLRGQITAARNASAGRIITLLGAEVLVDDDTKIERRGPAGGFDADDLVAGMLVDTRGTFEDSGLVATRLHVGNRTDEPIRVEFAGPIVAVADGKLTVDTEGGSNATVLTSSTTQIIGTPAVGAFAEVRGTLNANLEVVASWVRIKASRDADDEEREERERQNRGKSGNNDNNGNGRGEGRGRSGEGDDDDDADEFEREIRLVSAAGSTVHGSAEVEFEQEGTMIKQKLEIKLEGAAPSTEYRIRVSAGSVTLDFGSIRTNTAGRAEVNFTAVPEGKTVRDFTGVQIVNAAGAVVAQGTF